MKREIIFFILAFSIFTSCNQSIQQENGEITDGNIMAQIGNISVNFNYSGISPNVGSIDNIFDERRDTKHGFENTRLSNTSVSADYDYLFTIPKQYVNHIYLNFILDSQLQINASFYPQTVKYEISVINEHGSRQIIEEFESNSKTYHTVRKNVMVDSIITAVGVKLHVSTQPQGRGTSLTAIYFNMLKIFNSLDDSGLIVRGKNNNYSISVLETGSWADEVVLSPIMFHSNTGIRCLTLVKESSPIATPVRMKINPDGLFAKALLGPNNDGIVALGGRVIG